MNLTDLVPPLELCKQIPEGEFQDSALIWMEVIASATHKKTWSLMQGTDYARSRPNRKIPAPTLQEILEELHKSQQDVFLKWSEIAYHEWLVNAYTHNSRDFQAHDKNLATAALKVWLKLKGVEAS